MSLVSPQCLAGGGLAPGGCILAGPGGGIASTATSALTAVTLGAVVSWVLSGAKYVLNATANVLSETTAPQLTSTWFSSTYWRVAAIAAVLTLPFLFAAATQALVRSDLTLLLRAALGYLPLAFLAVGIAAPLTMLLLAAADQMSAIVSSTAGHQGIDFLKHATGALSAVAADFPSPFVLFLVGLLTVAGALVLWVELLVREAAVYVIVLMLPLAFAAFVWPARRIWAIRSIELLIALILSKFVIVAVLSLGGAALDHSVNRSVTGLLAGGVLMALATFAPWAMVRLIPLAEVASAAATSLKPGSANALLRLQQSDARASQAEDWGSRIAQMRELAGHARDPAPDPEADLGSDTSAGLDVDPGSAAAASPPDPDASPATDPASSPPGTAMPAGEPPPPMHESWEGAGPILDLEGDSDPVLKR